MLGPALERGRRIGSNVSARIVADVEDRRYNPSYEGTWADQAGVTWRRKGKRGHVLEGRRVRSLLRREGVPLVIWRSFEAASYDDVAAKLEADKALRASTEGDVRASEWESDDGRRLLMLEDFC